MTELGTEILVVGGGVGGVAAALAAASAGHRVVLTEETDWLGGQFTAQAVPPDENPWIERFGGTATYRRFREEIRAYYRRHYPLRAEASALADLNPGAGRVSKLCHEPRVALAVLESMLAPHRAAGRLTVLLGHRLVAAEVSGDRVEAVTVAGPEGDHTTIRAAYVLDATENGDVLPLTGTEFAVGAEAQAEHGEPHAPERADPGNLQGITYCFALSHHSGEDFIIDRPRMYGFWRDYRPDFWPGPLLGFLAPDPRSLEPVPRTFDPNPDTDPLAISADQSSDAGDKELWGFRRILARRLYQPGAFDSDITLVNWPLNDYWLRPALEIDGVSSAADVECAHDEAKQLSLSVLYWLQTEAPRLDGGTGFPGLLLRPDVVGTKDGLAKSAYVREGRRIRAVTTIAEQDVSLDILGPTGRKRHEDSVGIGSYRLDLHPSTSGDNYIDVPSVPFELPLGALLPRRMRNLLPAAKNIGTTHITNGCHRLHPVEWNIGEVAGQLAGFALRRGSEPREVHENPEKFAEFAQLLDRTGVERRWPEVRGY